MAEAYIIDACRTPRGVGKVGKGALAHLHPQHVGATVLAALRDRNDLNTADVDDMCSLCITNECDATLSCGHTFCSPCIELSRSPDESFISLISKAVIVGVGKECPLCKQPIKSVVR